MQLGSIDRDKPLLIGEGIESTLSARQISGLPGIATLGTEFMMAVNPPPAAEYIIVADNDDAGNEAAKVAAERLANGERKARIAAPDRADWNVALRKDGDKLKQLRERILGGKPIKPGEIEALGMQAFLELQFPPRQYLLKPWLTTTGLTMIDAPAGHGKTWLGLSIAYAVASGQSLLGWTVERRARVLYVDGELSGELLQNRLKMLGPALPECDLMILSHAQFEMQNGLMPDLGSEEGRDFLDRIIEQNHIDVVILDSVSTLVRSGVDNDVEGWREIQSWSLKHRGRGRAIIYLHHHGRSGNPRGTSSREIVLDARIKLNLDSKESNETETAFRLEFPKARDFWGPDAAPMMAYLSTASGVVEWRREAIKDPQQERVRELSEGGMQQKDIAKEIGVSRARISQIVKDIKEDSAS